MYKLNSYEENKTHSFARCFKREEKVPLLRVSRIIHWETLPNDYSVTASLYCQQLDQIAEELKGEQDRI